MIDDNSDECRGEIVQFGRRPIPPRACVVENKTHVRMFLTEMLDELGFIAREADTDRVRAVLRDFRPDLIVLGPLEAGLEVRSLLRTLQAQNYGGAVMLFGGRSSAALIRSHEFGEDAGWECCLRWERRFANATSIQFFPASCRSGRHHRYRLMSMRHYATAGWSCGTSPRSMQSRWYRAAPRQSFAFVIRPGAWCHRPILYRQPTIPIFMGCRSLSLRGRSGTPQSAAANHQVQISIPLPLLVLEDMQFIDRMMEHLPEKVRQNGFLIAVDCVDLVNDLALVRRIAGQLASRNIGIAINDIDAEGASLAGRRDLPVVEMKVDRKFIRGCADDRISRRIVLKL